ncbi:MAG TPA: putative metal-dependent hydrolase [Candidatus Acidoferrales bacterium]|jgi:uncharacterized damage-inducible protein DinB|nr:putative metal-dependent hydrolase [Candidatus Acidoferrales bacterium]
MEPEADLRYPIGKYQRPGALTDEQRAEFIDAIAETPDRLMSALKNLSADRLETPYRPGGWTVRQVVHHLPDSHMNAYVRMKLALTEDEPTIKPYDEARWAELFDGKRLPISPSLDLLETLHKRWVLMLKSLAPTDWARRFRHPEHEKPMSIDDSLALYAWHGKHHVAHITSLRERNGWR